uniref:Uncharacterized protein n=1 Tax=Micrurus spixii TaxID=129469 RepID=A0A2D4NC39_9SAUR
MLCCQMEVVVFLLHVFGVIRLGLIELSKHKDTMGFVTSHEQHTLQSAPFPHDIMTSIVSQQLYPMVLLIISFFSTSLPSSFHLSPNLSYKNYFLRLSGGNNACGDS